jgi:ACS family hexuronate transporter-like MFS transporter
MSETKSIGNYRWTICALVFFATTVNYLDRSVISLLKSTLTKELDWTDADYADIEVAFKFAYALGMVFAGRLIDKLGSKIGYFLATLLWSIAAVAHALVSTTLGFIWVRGALGLTESGNFPAAIKSTAEWFPKKERALATGIFNSGTNIGAIVAPLSVPFITEAWGWRWAFIITGSFGLIWLVLWMIVYDIPSRKKQVSKAELDYIHSDTDQPTQVEGQGAKISWLKLLTYRQTWAFAIGKFLTDPVWWFYLFWLPDFLESQYGIKGTDVAMPVALVYTISTVGSVFGGWLPLKFVNGGWPIFKARKNAMLIYAVAVIPIIFAQVLGSYSMWLAVLVIGWATSAHQSWSANIFTTVSDMFPKRAIGAVVGIGGMAGGLGGILLTALVQRNMFVPYRELGQIDTAYYIMFFICGGAYLIAWSIMHFLVPKFDPIKL